MELKCNDGLPLVDGGAVVVVVTRCVGVIKMMIWMMLALMVLVLGAFGVGIVRHHPIVFGALRLFITPLPLHHPTTFSTPQVP